MTDEERQSIKQFEAKVRRLIADYIMLQNENNELRQTLATCESNLATSKENLAQLQKDYDNLKLAKMISISDNEKKEAKQKITKMVRDINKCISILSSGKDEVPDDANEHI